MQENKSFMDKNTLVAIAVSFVIFLGWNLYLGKKYPNSTSSAANSTNTEQATSKSDSPAITTTNVNTGSPAAPESKTEIATVAEQLTHFDFTNWSFDLSSHGMGIKNIVIKNYKARDGKQMTIGSVEAGSFVTHYKQSKQPIVFDVKRLSPTEVVGTATNGGVTVEKKITIDPEKYALATKTTLTGMQEGVSGLDVVLTENAGPVAKSGFMSPALDIQEFVLNLNDKTTPTREIFNETTSGNKKYDKVRMASVGNLYFTTAVIDKSDVFPDVETTVNEKKVAMATVSYPLLSGSKNLVVDYTAFAGPKALSVLGSIDESLKNTVDLGMFRALANPMLKILNFFYSISKNWGVAIILLTLLVRLLVMPFNIMSFKSMKAMQDLKPKMDAVREKYKDNPAVMNQQIMSLMKENKVNPAGGCLPMLLQLPIFIALYALLAHSIDLYQAPFMFWIKDLSIKDPYFVLPVLMGITMFIQQKITPSTMDPAQAKVMLLMPVFFAFLMSSLPSGLTLYIFVSTLFGIIQQRTFLKDNKTVAAKA